MDRRDANQQLIREAESKQSATKDAIFRIQRQAAETEQIGSQTLEELRKQGSQMDDINADLEKVSTKLDQSSSLQNTFDKWAGNWFGGKKRDAMKEAAAEIAQRTQEELSKAKEVFEHEKFDSLSRTWKACGFVLCSAPTIEAPQVFDPAAQTPESNWMIDYSLSGIDAEGWTYAYDFASLNRTGAGRPAAAWDTYVRRRKWRYHEKRSGAGSAALAEIRERNTERLAKQKPVASTQAEKIGYVPRAQQARITASGLTSGGMMRRRPGQEQDLDAESADGLARLQATDAEIDEGISDISSTLDKIARIAGDMREEVTSQTGKLEKIDTMMQKTADKTAVVNARQKYLLR